MTAAVDDKAIEQWKAIRGRTGNRWLDEDLAGGWIVELGPGARIDRLRIQLPGRLREFEAEGIGDSSALPIHRLEQLRLLDIERIFQGRTSFPGSVYLIPAPRGAAWLEDLSEIPPWISEFLLNRSRQDIRTKLARSRCERTHAFVIVPTLTSAPPQVFGPLWEPPQGVPAASPTLPAEISDVWICGNATCLWWGVDGWRALTVAPDDA